MDYILDCTHEKECVSNRLSHEISTLKEEADAQRQQALTVNLEIKEVQKQRDDAHDVATSLKAQHSSLENDVTRAKEESRR